MPINGVTIKEDVNRIVLSHEKNRIMPFAATWMDLEIVILSEDRHNNKYLLISFICAN